MDKETTLLYEKNKILHAALTDMFAMLDEGLLVRDVSHDSDPDWVVRMMEFTGRLAANMEPIKDA